MDSTEKRYATIRKRLEALWENEILDRCCVSVLAPRDPQRPYRENPPESQEDLCRWYNDAQWIQERNLERIRRTYFAGDAFPCIFPYFGTGGHAKYICAEEKVEYRRDTIWIHPSLSDYFDYNYEFDPDSNKVFRRELDVVSYLAKEANGRYFVGMPDNCGSYDALAQLRGSGELLIDFLDEPEGVKYAAGQLIEILKRSSERFFDAVREKLPRRFRYLVDEHLVRRTAASAAMRPFGHAFARSIPGVYYTGAYGNGGVAGQRRVSP